MTKDPKQQPHGEGNYEATRDYNERTKRFLETNDVERAAEDAAPQDDREASEMRQAEEAGRSRAKEEDPALKRGGQQQGSDRTRSGGAKH